MSETPEIPEKTDIPTTSDIPTRSDTVETSDAVEITDTLENRESITTLVAEIARLTRTSVSYTHLTLPTILLV